ncbi:MAG: hypothetical protein ACTSWQ_01500 [Candidatus Thorarchaeota archaeon]
MTEQNDYEEEEERFSTRSMRMARMFNRLIMVGYFLVMTGFALIVIATRTIMQHESALEMGVSLMNEQEIVQMEFAVNAGWILILIGSIMMVVAALTTVLQKYMLLLDKKTYEARIKSHDIMESIMILQNKKVPVSLILVRGSEEEILVTNGMLRRTLLNESALTILDNYETNQDMNLEQVDFLRRIPIQIQIKLEKRFLKLFDAEMVEETNQETIEIGAEGYNNGLPKILEESEKIIDRKIESDLKAITPAGMKREVSRVVKETEKEVKKKEVKKKEVKKKEVKKKEVKKKEVKRREVEEPRRKIKEQDFEKVWVKNMAESELRKNFDELISLIVEDAESQGYRLYKVKLARRLKLIQGWEGYPQSVHNRHGSTHIVLILPDTYEKCFRFGAYSFYDPIEGLEVRGASVCYPKLEVIAMITSTIPLVVARDTDLSDEEGRQMRLTMRTIQNITTVVLANMVIVASNLGENAIAKIKEQEIRLAQSDMTIRKLKAQGYLGMLEDEMYKEDFPFQGGSNQAYNTKKRSFTPIILGAILLFVGILLGGL